MSHRDSCPDEWEARREARWDAHSGWNRHRYEDECPEANRAYESEYRRECSRMEEERYEEAHAAAAAAERRAEEDYWLDRAYEEQRYREAYPEPPYPEPEPPTDESSKDSAK